MGAAGVAYKPIVKISQTDFKISSYIHACIHASVPRFLLQIFLRFPIHPYIFLSAPAYSMVSCVWMILTRVVEVL